MPLPIWPKRTRFDLSAPAQRAPLTARLQSLCGPSITWPGRPAAPMYLRAALLPLDCRFYRAFLKHKA